MAEATEQEKILNIRVNYAEAVKGIQDYTAAIIEAKKRQADLDKQLEEGTLSADEYAEGIVTVQNEIKVYEGNVRSLNKEIQNNIKEQQAQDGSLVQLRAQLSNLTKAYDSLSATERESGKQGEQLRNSINEVTTKLKAAEEATQRYYRNVGNYENAIKNTLGTQSQWFQQLNMLKDAMSGGVAGGVKIAIGAVKDFGKQLLALMANPIVAAIAAIAVAFKLVSDAIKNNEENMDRWKVVTAPIGRIVELLSNAMQQLASKILVVVEAGGQMLGWLSKMMEKVPLLADAFADLNREMENSIELEREEQAIRNARRQEEVEQAKASLESQRLLTKAYDKVNYTAKERLEFLRQATKIEQERANAAEQLAKRELVLAQQRASISKNDSKTNDELAAKEAAYYQAQQQREALQTSLKQRESKLLSQIKSEESAAANEAKKRGEEAKKASEMAIEAKKKELEAIRQAEDALIALIKDNYEKQRAQVEISYDRRIEGLKKRLETEKNLTVAAQEAITQTIMVLYQQRADAIAAIEKQASEERLNQAIADEQKRLQLIIDTTKKGSQAQYDAKMALLQQQQDAATAEIEQSALTEQQKQERIDLVRQQFEQQRTELRVEQNELEMQAAQEAFELRIEQETNNAMEAARLEYEQKKASLDALHQMEGESNDAFRARELNATKAFTEAKKKYDQMQAQSEQAKLQVTAAVFGGMSQIMDAFGEESKEAAIASKVLALAQIAVSTGLAIAQGVQQAQSVPYPGNIVAIATTVATVLANIASAITTVKGAKFSEGGNVTGPGTATSDSIPAQLSNGESVMTAQATSMFAPLLSTLNQIGGGVPIVTPSPTVTTPSTGDEGSGSEILTEAFREALKDMPRPVVAVSEINDVQERVEVIEQLAAQ